MEVGVAAARAAVLAEAERPGGNRDRDRLMTFPVDLIAAELELSPRQGARFASRLQPALRARASQASGRKE